MKIQHIITIAAMVALPLSAQTAAPAAPATTPVEQTPAFATPEQDAENARISRELVDDLQACARSCKDVRLVISYCRWGSGIENMEIPLPPAEKEELLSLILKIEPVKADTRARLTPAFVIEILFTMPDGTVQRVRHPRVTGRSRVSSDGYAFMCRCALPDADAARWHALAKYDWIREQRHKGRNRAGK